MNKHSVKATAANAGSEEPDANSIRVFVVDDDADQREGLAAYLKLSGMQVAAAANYNEAMQVTEDYSPHLAVCDWNLGKPHSGIDVARRLQKRFGSRIIFLSGLPSSELRAATEDLRVLRYLKKPTEPRQIAKVIQAAFC